MMFFDQLYILILKFNSNQSLKGEPEPGELDDNKSTAKKDAVKKTKSNSNLAQVNKTAAKVSKKSNKRDSFDSLLEDKNRETNQDEPASSNRKKGRTIIVNSLFVWKLQPEFISPSKYNLCIYAWMAR